MRRLLVINPNTSLAVSQRIDALVSEEAAGAADIRLVTAGFGFSYISTRAAITIAEHAVLDAAARAMAEGPAPDAIVLACFGDPGREALAEMTGLPVAGFAEAGLLAAAQAGRPLVATSGSVWVEVLRELAMKLGIADEIAGFRSIDGLADDPVSIAAFLEKEAEGAGAERIVLGGAGLIPVLPAIVASSRIPVMDPHRVAIRKALRLAAEPRIPATPAPATVETFGLSSFLSAALAGL